MGPLVNKIVTVLTSIVITHDCGVILRGYVMGTLGVIQMLVRYEAPLILYHSQDLIDPENTTGEDRLWRPIA